MKRENKNRGRLAACLITALLLAAALLCACGGKQAETTAMSQDGGERTEDGAPPTAGLTTAPEPARTEEAPEEDPWAEGYYYDAALTEGLRALFATDNTNNTAEGSPSRSMTPAFLEQLDAEAAKWLYEGIPDSEEEEKLLALSFCFQEDPEGTVRALRSVRAGIYGARGNDPETVRSRILLGNTEPCFYLFLRAYYSPALDRARVYMINGLVW